MDDKAVILDESGHSADSSRRLITGAAAMLAMKAARLGMDEAQINEEAKELQAMTARAKPIARPVFPRLMAPTRRGDERLRDLKSGAESSLEASDGTRYFKSQEGSIRKIVNFGAPTKVEHNKGRIRRARKAARL